MGTCKSVIQNRCRMQGRCVFGGICKTACLRDSNHLHSVPISHWHQDSSRSKKKPKAVWRLMGSRTSSCSLISGSLLLYTFSLASSATKLVIFKADETQTVHYCSWNNYTVKIFGEVQQRTVTIVILYLMFFRLLHVLTIYCMCTLK